MPALGADPPCLLSNVLVLCNVGLTVESMRECPRLRRLVPQAENPGKAAPHFGSSAIDGVRYASFQYHGSEVSSPRRLLPELIPAQTWLD